MKISCSREDLTKNLQIAQRATDQKSNVMVLRNVLISAHSDGTIEVVGFDHKIGIKTKFHGVVERPGQITCPSNLLTDVLGVKMDKDIHLSVTDTILELESGRAKYKFSCIPADEFPPFDADLSGKNVMKLNSKLFRKGVSQTVFATNPDDSRAFMGGILIVFEKGKMEFVATDGHRLAKRTLEDQKFSGDPRKVIAPARTLHELLKILPTESDEIQVAVSGPSIIFAFDSIVMTSRLIETEYPKFEKVIPAEHKGKCVVNRQNLISAVRGAAIMARTKENRDLIEIVVVDGCMRFTSNTQDVGSAFEEVEATKEGDDLTVAFNSRYVLDFLQSIENEEVTMRYRGNLDPALFTTDDPGYIHVLMPIKI